MFDDLTRRDLFRIGALAGAAAAGLGTIEIVNQAVEPGPRFTPGKTTGAVTRVPSMCQMCTTACGIIANVREGRLLTIEGNPEDPNSRGSICAKGVAGPSVLYDPYRLLYPLKRVGRRGEGRWRRISWEEAYDEIADRLRAIRESGHPEEFALQQGRNRSKDIVRRFLNAYGTPSHFTHRALCSLNRRAAILTTIGESDWDLGDFENSRYILNFGCNWAEAHQGHIPVATRMMRAREHNNAKIVTLESRLSNTAALSDEWFCVKPGTDGLIALAMSNVICAEGLWDKEWFDTWCNYPADKYAEHVRSYTPERAEAESGMPATAIRRIAREFAAAAPRCTTICNRGSHAHRNGFYNDRAITVLNALVGNMGKAGGWCWHPNAEWDDKQFPEPGPIPPKPTVRSVIADAKDWPLANAWQGREMKVGEIVYLWIKERRQRVSALMTYNCDQAWAWPEANLVRDVLADEELIPFHFCMDVMYSETAHLADIVLPWTTYLERWDIDARPPQGLVDYVGLRQPVVRPLGETKDLREVFPELARRIGGGMERYFPWQTPEEYFEEYFRAVPGGLSHMRAHGAWQDPRKRPHYLPYERRLSDEELAGSEIDEPTGVIYKGTDPKTGERQAIGILINGIARRGFTTPSRKVEVSSTFIAVKGEQADKRIDPLPIYDPIPSHSRPFAADELIMISFKWNVHNAHRTGQSKWLQEIVHSNPAWLNTATAAQLGLSEGDWIEVTSFRPHDPHVPHGDGSELGSLRTRVHLTEGVHPSVIAISHNSGRSHGGPIATNGRDQARIPAYGPASHDAKEQPWWAGALSVPQNDIMPIYPDPVSGQQAYHDTIVRIRKL
ncbi:anaerobic selenocysteine-containing dehydrogenase [Nonomuraea polychroma]|uniref:Anaerobic selenocysteine-containing dehydrogenase n=1 Tax=Nonomuraea polychroma TaxID=46176 RepID=A0A438M2H5_9ACTN|nr:molybdopterin-dependent oxidoreductase [Nonomuraea polychroma]RVX39797.1 anaerobic selenocysteine-containing dehydrogenase [Nonomuraea polychroma]